MKLFGKTFLALLALVFLLSACAKPTTGIKGKVVLAKCTGQEIATDCTAISIYSATLIVYDEKLVKLKMVKTKGDGTFLVTLKPGTYYVSPQPAIQGKFPMASDFKVLVLEGKMADLTVYYDTGFREGPAPTSIPTPG